MKDLSEVKGSQDLNHDCVYTITGFFGDPQVIERLKSLGFLEQRNFKVKNRISFGGPLVVEMNSSTFALRKSEFECLRYEQCKK